MAERIQLHLNFETRLSPERVAASLVDFSERRLERWPNIDPARFELHETGPGWAIVTEGTAEPPVWARERYEWAGAVITITAIESNFCVPGDGTRIEISPAPSGGSKVALDWEREAATPDWQPLMDAFKQDGERFLLVAYRDRWDAMADHEGQDAPS